MNNHHLDQTHDPTLRSWVESANVESSDFPIQNLPFGIFSHDGAASPKRIGVAIGDKILDLPSLFRADLVSGYSSELKTACSGSALNQLMALEPASMVVLRRRLSELLSSAASSNIQAKVADFLHESPACRMHLPVQIGDYTDFYASIDHASNVGKLFRPENPLLPNYQHVPIGYHGRSSSIVLSGSPVIRPRGQWKQSESVVPSFAPTAQLDYELELGLFVRGENAIGSPTLIGEAENRIFGFCLLNDWSARDIQTWEYQPLGPFLGKNFTTTISPWILTAEALAPFRVPARRRLATDPQPLPYLFSEPDQRLGGYSIQLEVCLQSRLMKQEHHAPVRVSVGNSSELYWTFSQMITHHTSNGCNLRPGDLLGTGTISGAEPDSRGCLLELTDRGKHPIKLPNGEERAFLDDGDEVIFKARCSHQDYRPIGFGECSGLVRGSLG